MTYNTALFQKRFILAAQILCWAATRIRHTIHLAARSLDFYSHDSQLIHNIYPWNWPSQTVNFTLLLQIIAIFGCSRYDVEHSNVTKVHHLSDDAFTTILEPVMDNAELNGRFTVTNTSTDTTTILGAVRSCSCTTVYVDGAPLKAGSRIKPGQQFELSIVAKPPKYNGLFTITCDLQNDAGLPWAFKVRGAAYKYVAFERPSIYLGAVDPRSVLEQETLVSTFSKGNVPHEPSVSSSNSLVSVAIKGSTVRTLPGNINERQTRVLLTLNTNPMATGTQHSIVKATATRTQSITTDTSDLMVSWVVNSPYTLSPSTVYVRLVPGSDTIIRKHISVRLCDSLPFKVVSLTTNMQGIYGNDFDVTHLTKNEQILSVLVDPGKISQRITCGQIVVSTDYALFPEITLQCVVVKDTVATLDPPANNQQ